MEKSALICEDNCTTAYCIKAMLNKIGYEADIAQNAKDTLICLNNKSYDLLTLDIILPDMNGLDLLKEIRNTKKTKDMPIVVVSATKKEGTDLNSEKNISWLEKSFDSEDLAKAMEIASTNTEEHKIEVLYIENDPDLLSLMDITLSDIANLTQITNLAEAKSVLATKRFDVIILDYVFPNGTSDKLIPDIKSGPNKNAKLIMFSAYEECKMLSRYFDSIIIKTQISYGDFKKCIEEITKS